MSIGLFHEDGAPIEAWTRALSAGPWLRCDEDSWQETVVLARDTMRRVRKNVERLVARLTDAGYRFERTDWVHLPPAADAAAQVDELESLIGPVPLSLRVWWEEIGSVDLNGRHKSWKFDYPDPLVVHAPFDYVRREYDEWRADDDRVEPFVVDLAPDWLHKADVSGGAPYGLAVPNEAVDGLLLGEFHQTTFVNYLRIAFAWGGFPGFDRREPDWARAPETPPLVRELAAELLPI
jgi:hypothetical protein